VLQQIRANWKAITGQSAATGSAIEGGSDTQRLSVLDTEPSPCGVECGCPDAEWCVRSCSPQLRVVPDLDAAPDDTEEPNIISDALRADSYPRMSDAGMSTVEYAVGTVVAAAFAAVLYKIVTGDSVVAGLTNLINTALSTTF
jgi:hypothetical protein